MFDPIQALRMTWHSVAHAEYPDGIPVRRPGGQAKPRNATPDEIAANFWQLIGRKLDTRRALIEPMLVWASEGTVTEKRPDGRESMLETIRLDFRTSGARSLAESFRLALNVPQADTWEYQPDDYAIDLMIDRDTLHRFSGRRVALVVFRLL